LQAKEGIKSKGSFTVQTLKSLATESDPSGMVVAGTRSAGAVDLSSSKATKSDGVDLHQAQEVKIELDCTREQLRQAKMELLTTSEVLHVTKGEKELYRLQFAAISGETPDMDMDAAFVGRAAAYEKEIVSLKEMARKVSVASISQEVLSPETSSRLRSKIPSNDSSNEATLESPEFVRLRSKVLQSISHSDQLEVEEQAESTEIATITGKYLEPDLDDDEQCRAVPETQELQTDEYVHGWTGGSLRQTQVIEAHLCEISRSIETKEDLINQLQLSQEKYAVSGELICALHNIYCGSLT
jgi:hypothetical protein